MIRNRSAPVVLTATPLVLTVALLGACTESSPTEVGSTRIAAVTPVQGATGFAIDGTIEVRFDGPISTGAMPPIALQMGDCPGPVVMGTWTRTPDGLALRFDPSQPLDPATMYTIHMGGGLLDADGARVDLEGNASGGTWVTREMVMGMTGMGMGMSAHSGPEWQSANGMYGLAFSFTTAP